MLLKTVLVLLACIIGTATCDDVTSTFPRMVGGTPTLPGDAPSVVSIRVPLSELGATAIFCTGTIVNVNHILTSCRCAHNSSNQLLNPAEFQIIAGDLNVFLPSFRRFTTSASHIYTHPDYTVNPRTNDIAVMRTSTPFPVLHNTIDWSFRTTHVLPNGHNCRFVGWGSPAAGGLLNPIQQQINTPILDRNLCNAPNVHGGLVLDNMICAGTFANTPGVCIGNLGGGCFVKYGIFGN